MQVAQLLVKVAEAEVDKRPVVKMLLHLDKVKEMDLLLFKLDLFTQEVRVHRETQVAREVVKAADKLVEIKPVLPAKGKVTDLQV